MQPARERSNFKTAKQKYPTGLGIQNTKRYPKTPKRLFKKIQICTSQEPT